MSVIYDQALRQRISIFIGITVFCRFWLLINRRKFCPSIYIWSIFAKYYLVPLVDQPVLLHSVCNIPYAKFPTIWSILYTVCQRAHWAIRVPLLTQTLSNPECHFYHVVMLIKNFLQLLRFRFFLRWFSWKFSKNDWNTVFLQKL